MLYTWEEEDIKVGRMFASKPALQQNADIGYVASTLHMIGYIPALTKEAPKFVTISMSDGMICGPYHVPALLEVLNSGEYVPAHHNLVMDVFKDRRERTEGLY